MTKSSMRTTTAQTIIRELENHFVPSLRNCGKIGELKKIHANIVKLSLSQSNFLVTKMLDVCDNCGDIDYATLLFEQLVEPNAFSYNAIIRTYAHNHAYNLAITQFKQMLRAQNHILPDKFTFPFVIKSSAGLLSHPLGQQIHAQLCKFGPESHSITENALIDMYTKCDDLTNAHKVFEQMTNQDVFSWNGLIYGHARLGQMERARTLFDGMPCRTIVSWTTMITGYARNGCYADALDIFRKMQVAGIEPDEISLISVLPACSQLGALEVGRWIHLYSDKNGFLQKTNISNALIEMYSKCGCIDEARNLFDELAHRDVISWSTMIGALANHGKAHEAIELFQDMQKALVFPNKITFLGILTACTHAGLLNEGLKYFDSMRENYNIEPEIEHYGCLVDLLGRCGRLDKALDTILKMPIEPDSRIWGSLLSSCRTHKNLEIAIIAMEHHLELEPDASGSYVMLANIYAELGKWEDVSSIRKAIRSKRIKKTPGCSLIEIDNLVQEFLSDDYSKPFAQEIYGVLELLAWHQNRTSDLVEFLQEDTGLA
ncbi:hypothetical protein L6164_024173 [Bauhinia variegata]|uniref:Uncharacterized protein n=1 Tax=Bauhinia variegata TaxID=167791 RepID=A0ACB9LWS6_BAUVA|nr:hypothetical protein L6164_024173 [Bauhinia variegata]